MNNRKRYLKVAAIVVLLILVFFSGKFYSMSKNKYGSIDKNFTSHSGFISQSEKPCNVDEICTTTHNIENNSRIVNKYNHQKQNSHKSKYLPRKSCSRPPFMDITTEKQAYIKPDGLKGYRIGKKYYDLNTNLGKNDEAFFDELNLKLNSAFQYIENQLGIAFNQAITLNIVFKATRTGYEDYVREQGASPEGSQGIYLSKKNLAIVEIRKYEQGLNTAVHEATHALNEAYWGRTYRFFNEGLAEYLEVVTTKGDIPSFDFSWLTQQQYPKQISTLLFSEVDWHRNQSHQLYQNSKALFHFLMSDTNGRKVVWKIMKQEMEDPCRKLPKDKIVEILFDVFPNHQQEFDYWFSEGLQSFLNRRNN